MFKFALTRKNRMLLGRAFRDVRRVDIAIDSVIDGQMGKAFVDDPENPTAFKLQIDPFGYFAGSFQSPAAADMVKNLEPYELIMVCPEEMIEIAGKIHGDKLTRFPRYSFSSESLSVEHIAGLLDASPFRDRIAPFDKSLLDRISTEPDHFIDISAFDSVADFLERGIGFYMSDDGHIIGCAYSSLVSNTGIEVSIFVVPEHRRKGLAAALGCALIEYCLEHGIEPHWDAANPESCTLAEKLGYLPDGTYDAYYIKP